MTPYKNLDEFTQVKYYPTVEEFINFLSQFPKDFTVTYDSGLGITVDIKEEQKELDIH